MQRLDVTIKSELAVKLDVDKTTVSNWESGRRQLALDRLIQIAQVLNVSVTFLLGLDEQVSPSEQINITSLPVLHRMPIWTRSKRLGAREQC